MNKLEQKQYPRHGVECIFTMSDGSTFKGHYDNGGARNPNFVFNTEIGKSYSLPTTELINWSYTNK